MVRNSYHTSIKIAHALDIQKQWLPNSFLQSIPRSTSHAWKDDYVEKFVGYEFASNIGDNVSELKMIYNQRVQFEKRLFMAYVRIKLTIVQLVGKDVFQSFVRENFKVIYNLMLSVHGSMGVSINQFRSFIGLTPQSFHSLKKRSQRHCTNSATGVCIKHVSGQESLTEINTMRRLLRRKRFAQWPISSVWALAVRKGMVKLSLSAWYKNNRMFQFRDKKRKWKNSKLYDPLRASYPNQIWHADITMFKTLDGVKHYVYPIVDNYSKFILSWKVHSKCNGAVRTQTLKETIRQEFGDDLIATQRIDLIVDGGTENNNQTIEQYIKSVQIDIDKKVALKDIIKSNSMVEASNKILKHRYLYRFDVLDREHLIEHLNDAIFDFNYQRPHNSLSLFTPFEVHYNKKPDIKSDSVKNHVKACLPVGWNE